ncbi:hypothetical protein RhiJN_10152 [Ceratobasidium sp. AG-Ba]|nr:hypothetical protein RhiJN_10152 [Ceratobasidium sp. AG-Ba]
MVRRVISRRSPNVTHVRTVPKTNAPKDKANGNYIIFCFDAGSLSPAGPAAAACATRPKPAKRAKSPPEICEEDVCEGDGYEDVEDDGDDAPDEDLGEAAASSKGKKAKGEKGKLKSKANEREMIKRKCRLLDLHSFLCLVTEVAQTRFKLPEFADTAMLTDAFFNKSGQLLALSIAKSNAAEEAAAHALKLRVEHLETLNDAEREDFLVEMRHDTIKACAQVEEKVQKLRRDNIELKGALKNLEKENTQAIVDKDEGGEGGGTD